MKRAVANAVATTPSHAAKPSNGRCVVPAMMPITAPPPPPLSAAGVAVAPDDVADDALELLLELLELEALLEELLELLELLLTANTA